MVLVGADIQRARADDIPPPPNGWTACTPEGGICVVPAGALIAFGNPNGWVQFADKGGTNVQCDYTVLGDPASGPKVCYTYSLSPSGIPTDGSRTGFWMVTGCAALMFGLGFNAGRLR